jgi:hypothetical protein
MAKIKIDQFGNFGEPHKASMFFWNLKIIICIYGSNIKIHFFEKLSVPGDIALSDVPFNVPGHIPVPGDIPLVPRDIPLTPGMGCPLSPWCPCCDPLSLSSFSSPQVTLTKDHGAVGLWLENRTLMDHLDEINITGIKFAD